jgi:hypothetical protein
MNAFSTAKSDKINSTYRHIIQFGDSHPIVGYSKKENFDEKEDKRLLLVETIGRLALSNFQKGAWEFEIYRRKRENAALQYTEEKVLSLYPDGYQLHNAYQADALLTNYLSILLNTKDSKRAMTVFQGYSGLTFSGKTYEDLCKECNVLVQYYPRDRVKRLFVAVRDKYGWGEVAAAPTIVQEEVNEGQTTRDISKRSGGMVSMADLTNVLSNI